jgi:S-DNA-T family DNA segregation ATPase FtsK/SpoIIIE
MASDTKKKSTASKKRGGAKKPAAPEKQPVRREVWAAVCFFVGLFAFIGYFNIDAIFFTYVCGFVKALIGYGYWIFPVVLFAASVVLLFHRGRPVALRTPCVLLLPLVFSALVHLFAVKSLPQGSLLAVLWDSGREVASGGVLGGLLAIGLQTLVSVYGAVPVLFFAFLALLLVALRLSPAQIADKLRAHERIPYVPEPEPEQPLFAAQDAADAAAIRAHIDRQEQRRARRAIDIPMDEDPQEAYQEKRIGFFNASPRGKTPDQVYLQEPAEAPARPAPQPAPPQPEPTANVRPLGIQEAAKLAGVTVNSAEEMIRADEISAEQVRELRSNAKKTISADELRDETASVAKAVAEKDAEAVLVYQYPPLDLLRRGSANTVDGREEININSERLQTTLDSFGVNAAISDITRGPTVTRYDVELETGVKLSKLTNLAGDLALSLGVTGVRIAPIPNRISTVGIEVPNKIVSTVYLRDILDSDAFRAAGSKLTFAIGKDIGGSAIVGNVAKLPHLLIAGTTGSGKSVCMNSLILSLLYKATPEEVRLIMIDPKMVELGIYNDIPHLYVPVVTDPKKAAGSLQWSVIEMLKRYRLFSECGVRDIAGYNAIRKKDGEPILPQVVIVIDELADLMMTAAKEVEESICRVAQMGRAAGVHLVIATQRPSADVITGLMKANIPSRIAFAVSSAMESRIILDQSGAEKLVGAGDMLYAPLGVGKPVRIQGAFVTDEEREAVVDFVKQNGGANYNEEIQAAIEKAAEDKPGNGAQAHAESVDEAPESSYDELLPQAVDVIFETKQASVSMLQRRLKLGYSRAARIVDQMEELGVVGSFEGSKPRQILITKEQWQEMQTVQGTAPLDRSGQQMAFSDYRDEEPENWSE